MTKPRLTGQDYTDAAAALDVEVAAIKAVTDVEAPKGGFLEDERVRVLFERHKFHKYTGGIYDKSHPNISQPSAGGYGPEGAHQYARFSMAFRLNPKAAMFSCSWGKFQIMGFNFAAAGFPSVDEFVTAMKESEGAQLQAFVKAIKAWGLADEMRGHAWAAFAAAYNGSQYRKNKYDVKLAAAYRRHLGDATPAPPAPVASVGHSVAEDLSDEEVDVSVAEAVDSSSATPPAQETSVTVSAPTETITIEKAKPEESPVIKGVQTHWVAISGFVTTAGIGVWKAITGAPSELILGFFGAAALIAMTYMIARVILRNKENARQVRREEMAHELTIMQMKLAADRSVNTVLVK